MRERIYSNRYVLGSWLRPFALVVAQTAEVLFRAPILLLVGGAVAVWLSGLVFGWDLGPSNPRHMIRTIAILGFVGALAVLCIAWLGNTWARYRSIVRARAEVRAGSPLLWIDGPARFSGGSQGTRQSASYSPISLEIAGRSFDLVACANRHELDSVRTLPFVQSESDPRGAVVGFQVQTPLRIWYTPSGVIVHVEVETPEGALDPARRGELLKEKWLNRTGSGLSEERRREVGERLANAEEAAEKLRSRMSPAELAEAEKRIEKLKQKFQTRGPWTPDR